MHASTKLVCSLILGSMFSMTAMAADYLQDAREYYDRKEYRAAVIQLKNALQETPDNKAARLLLAKIHLETGDAAAAEKEFRQARRLGAKREAWVRGLAQSMLLQTRFDAVLSEIEVVSSDPPALQADILVLRGQALIAKGEAERAGQHFRQALEHDGNHADARLGLAQLAFNAGDFERATEFVDAALDVDPGAYSARFIKAQILAAQELETAADWFDKALEARPDDISARLGKAKFLITQGDFARAQPEVERLRAALPDSPQVRYLAGLIDFNAGNLEPARVAFNDVLAAEPKHAPAMLFLGTIHYQEDNLDQARFYLRDYLEYVPGNIPARQMLGSIHLRQGKAREAIGIMQPGADAANDNAGYLALLGAAHMQVGEVEQAMQYLQRAREIAPEALPLQAQLAMGQILQGDSEAGLEDLRALTDGQGGMEYDRLLVMSYLALKDYPGALHAVEAMREKYPDSVETINLHGIIQLAMEERDAARKTLKAAIAQDESFTAAYINLANIEFQEGNHAEAAAILKRAEAHGAESAQILLARARLAEATGDQAGAGSLYRRAYENHEGELPPGLAYADYLARSGDPDKATAVLSGLNRRHPGDPRVLARLGMVQLDSGDLANAEASIKSLLEKTPENGHAHFLLGRVHLARDRVDQAIPALERALELGVDDIQPQVLLVESYAAEGQDEKALQLIEQTRRDYPDIGLGFELEGDFHMRREAPEKALEAYRQAYAISTTRPLMTKLYRVHKLLDQPVAARAMLEEWLQDNPEDTGIRLVHASSLSRAGETGAALQQYQAVIESEPENLAALNNAAVIAADTNPGLGLDYARRAYELASSRPEIIDTYGWLLLSNDRPQEAERLLKEAAVLAPHIPEIRYHLAVAYHRNGRDSAALLELREIEDSFDALPDAAQARSLYQKLNGKI